MPEDAPQPARHLLFVDDEPVILQILRAVFEDEPHRVTCVGTGAEALRILDEQGCDVLLTDKNLPDLSGIELLRAAKERNPSCEVIVITGYASLETAIEAVGLGAFDYIKKPLDNVFDIKKKVAQALERQAMRLENARLVEELQERNRSLEDALAEAQTLQAELIQSEKLAGLGTLAAGIAHEVSSPLFGVLGLAEAIVDEDDIDVAHGHAREIVDYSRQIRDIVVELTRYARAPGEVAGDAVPLLPVVEDALRLVERAVPVDGVALLSRVPTGLSVRATRTEAQQVVVNLVKNAVEAVRDAHPSGGGRVWIDAARRDDTVVLTVEDNGPGIPEDQLGVVFDPFFTTKAPGQGTGLGLNVVYRIATKHRGSVQVARRSEGGTRFTVRLEAAD